MWLFLAMHWSTKYHAAAFVKKYPKASVWITPGQYGPYGSCGLDKKSCRMGYRVDGVLPVGAPSSADLLPPWSSEIDLRVLYVTLPENAGPVSEAAFLHKASTTLVTTDAVVYIPDEAPPIFGTYFNEETIRQPGFWPRSVLQAVFLPLRQGEGPSIDEQWPGYGALRGRLIRAPILRAFAGKWHRCEGHEIDRSQCLFQMPCTLPSSCYVFYRHIHPMAAILDARAPDAVRDWVKSIPEMGKFDRILTAHFASPIAVSDGAADFLSAFKYLDGPTSDPPISCKDWELLDGLNSFISDNKLGAPVKEGFDFKAGCPP